LSRTDRFVSTSAGRIHHVDEGAGEPLLLLHSNGCSLHEFDPVLDSLGQHYRCIAWDMPGHGDSDPPAGHRSIADYAHALLAFLDALGIERAHVCGASVGGFIAIAFGLIAPERAASVLIAEAALRSADEWARQWPRIEAMFAVPQQSREQVAPRFRALDAEVLARWNIDRHKAGGYRMVDVMWAIRDYDVAAALAQLAVPAAVIIGDRGPVADCQARYRELLPHAAIEIIADAGHFPMIDDPAAFTAAVTRSIAAAKR
jgi:pimeloyl-ACP methyl ester carboxylesterase